jgi:hypothetical protein
MRLVIDGVRYAHRRASQRSRDVGLFR